MYGVVPPVYGIVFTASKFVLSFENSMCNVPETFENIVTIIQLMLPSASKSRTELVNVAFAPSGDVVDVISVDEFK